MPDSSLELVIEAESSPALRKIARKVIENQRISPDEGLILFEEAPTGFLGSLANHIRYSRHGDRERQNDGLSLAEVEQALGSGRIIEQYGDTGRGESCLLAGFTDGGKPVHVVCGRMNDGLVVITVYIPMPPK
ncbi:MAG TPA: DUF4258 domain-containing protein, partial [Saprospiraceae bacterium]|nr:DUF4258 domain-containing protein [Saprospiraceae bacterium]